METKNKIDLLCWLTKAKQNSTFYKKNRKEINQYILILKASIDADKNPKKHKLDPLVVKEYAISIIKLIIDYFKNST
jgi:hypothetical protein